jgi:hypothetical protein
MRFVFLAAVAVTGCADKFLPSDINPELEACKQAAEAGYSRCQELYERWNTPGMENDCFAFYMIDKRSCYQ